MRELQRDLAGRPLAGVVDADDEVHGAAVLRPLFTLPAISTPSIVRPSIVCCGQRDGPDAVRVLSRPAPSARSRSRRARGRSCGCRSAGSPRRPAAARRRHRPRGSCRSCCARSAILVVKSSPVFSSAVAVGGRVEHDVGGPLADVVRHVEAEVLEPVEVAPSPSLTLTSDGVPSCFGGSDVDELHRERAHSRARPLCRQPWIARRWPLVDPGLRELASSRRPATSQRRLPLAASKTARSQSAERAARQADVDEPAHRRRSSSRGRFRACARSAGRAAQVRLTACAAARPLSTGGRTRGAAAAVAGTASASRASRTVGKRKSASVKGRFSCPNVPRARETFTRRGRLAAWPVARSPSQGRRC